MGSKWPWMKQHKYKHLLSKRCIMCNGAGATSGCRCLYDPCRCPGPHPAVCFKCNGTGVKS